MILFLLIHLSINNKFFFYRQNSYHRRAMPDKDVSFGSRGHVCPFNSHLFVDDFLLLHEEMAITAKNDALKLIFRNRLSVTLRVYLI